VANACKRLVALSRSVSKVPETVVMVTLQASSHVSRVHVAQQRANGGCLVLCISRVSG